MERLGSLHTEFQRISESMMLVRCSAWDLLSVLSKELILVFRWFPKDGFGQTRFPKVWVLRFGITSFSHFFIIAATEKQWSSLFFEEAQHGSHITNKSFTWLQLNQVLYSPPFYKSFAELGLHFPAVSFLHRWRFTENIRTAQGPLIKKLSAAERRALE